MVPLLAAIAGCHCWAAIAGCHCWVPLLGIGGGWVYTLADWTWCRCWLPLLGAIAGDGGGVGVHVGGLDVVAVAGCHCWVPLSGDRGGGCTRWRIGRGAVAGCHCWAAIAGDRGGVGVQVGGLDLVTLLGAVAIAGLPLLGAVALLAAIAGCHCWAAIGGDRGGGCTRWRIGRGAVAAAIAGLPLLGIGGGGWTSWRIGW